MYSVGAVSGLGGLGGGDERANLGISLPTQAALSPTVGSWRLFALFVDCSALKEN